jgi:hypothetical protein
VEIKVNSRSVPWKVTPTLQIKSFSTQSKHRIVFPKNSS